MGTSGHVCSGCATPVPEGALYCPNCGTPTPTEFDSARSPVPLSPQAPPARVSTPDELKARRAQLQHALGAAFELRELVGQGGFGEVWAAWDVRLKRDVAVKVLLADLAASPGLHQRFAREAEAAARLRHPNIIPIYQVGEADGQAYIIMPLVRGESLRTVLAREGALAIPDARRILAEAAFALEAAHKAGIVHRDVKPENIMLEGDERRVLLMDFGIARAMAEDSARLTGTGLVIGTPQYMSPEQATAEKHIDHRADIYSLGVVAYETLTGTLPFDATTGRDLIVQHLTAEPRDPRASRAEVPEDVAEAILRCMAKEPDERWSSAGELARVLQPPVTTSEVSPLVWIGRRLRAGVRRSRRRIVIYVSVLAAVLLTVGVFNPGALVGGWRYWRWRVQTLLHPAPAPAAPPATAPTRSWSTLTEMNLFGVTIDVAQIGDSLLVVRSGRAGPQAFDGATWRTIPVAGQYVLPFVRARDGTTWVYTQRGQLTVGVQLAPAGPAARDTVRGSVQTAWSDGSQALLGLADGGLLRGQPGAWHRDPTGTSTRLAAIAGDAHRQVAMGYFATADRPDSLLVFNGLNWQVTDPRPDTTRHWVYNAGDALKDGTLVIAGQDCAVGQTGCRALVALLAPGQRAWRAVAHMPADVEFLTLLVAGPDELWLSGRGKGCSGPPCVYRLAHDSVEAVRGPGRGQTLGIARLHGDIMVVTVDGLLWTRRGGQWGVLGTVPGSLADGTLPVNGGTWSGATVIRDGVAGVRGEVVVDLPGRASVFFQSFPTLFRPLRCAAGDSVRVRLSADWDSFAFILDPAGRRVAYDDDNGGNLNALVRWKCPDDRTYRVGVRGWETAGGPFRAIITRGARVDTMTGSLADGARRIYATLAGSGTVFQRTCAVGSACEEPDSAGAPRGVTAIARLGSSVMAAAPGGRVLLGPRWEPMPSQGAMGTIIALAGGDSAAAALTRNAVWLWTGRGSAATWRSWQALPSWLGQPQRIAVAADGRSAVVVGELGTGLFHDSTASQFATASDAVSDGIILPDGRVVLATPSADPLVEGAVRVFRPGATSFGERITIPSRVNVRGLAASGTTLYVSTSGWTQSQIRFGNLPFAPAADSTP